jgi:hypothetical protein
VPYCIGRPDGFLSAAGDNQTFVEQVFIAEADCTPRISRISGTVAGCL